ncbi:MAG: GrpB family protein [Deltaproteobacteria bacterium]|nr:GrpB family protein [Deltaproteobacteria bacterium]
MRHVHISAYDPEWPRLAEREIARFASAVGARGLVAIHHIGSTSVPGLAAKPLIDLMPEVEHLAVIDRARTALEASGYAFWGEYGIAERRFCPRIAADGTRLVNVHCFACGDPGLARHLAFRDYLRAYPEMARAYADEKRRCAALHPDDPAAYSDAKGAFVRRVEADALAWWRERVGA